MALRRRAFLPLFTIVGVFLGGACAADDPAKPPPLAPPPLDPPHCAFETPPKRAAGGPTAKAPIKAGVGSAVLSMPIGAPLGGYGARLIPLGQSKAVDARKRRFAKSFVPSAGMHDAPRASALALSAGDDLFVIVRTDLPLLNENALFDVESAVAKDGSMRGRILLTASHSHAAWAGWQPSLVLMPGIDRPRKDLEARVVASVAEAVKSALAAMEPAKIGVAVDSTFDPADEVNRDRREDNNSVVGPDGNTAGKGKDAVVWALRVDRADGSPLAALVDVPLHGTIGEPENPLVSTDAPGAVGRALSAKLGYPVLHLQGAAGDVSPAGARGREACPDPLRCLDMPRMEAVGARAAAKLAPLVSGITTGSEATFEVVTRTFYSGRGAVVHRPDGTELMYAPFDPSKDPDGLIFGADGEILSPIDEFNTDAGAGLCGDKEAVSFAAIPGTIGVGAYSPCLEVRRGGGIIFGLFEVPADRELPLCDTIRTTASAIRVSGAPSGDYLIVGVPGEPTAPYTAYLRGLSPAGPERTLIIGYADDYAGYMLTAEDWLAGGYEPSTNIWGPLEGEIILDGILKAADIAWSEEREDPEDGSSRFVDWAYPEGAAAEAVVTKDHGTKADGAAPAPFWPDTAASAPGSPSAHVERVKGAARFAFWGGDPAVDMPEIIVEKETAPGSGQFEPLTDARGRAASSRDGAVVFTYTPDPLDSDAPERHLYAAVFQPVPPDPFLLGSPEDAIKPYSLPLGVYRLRARGKALSTSGIVDYEVSSAAFEVVAATLDAGSSASKAGDHLQIKAILGSTPGMRALRDGESDHDITLPGPWTVTVTLAGGGTKSGSVTPDASGSGALSLSAGDVSAAISVDVRDPAGNGGVLAIQ